MPTKVPRDNHVDRLYEVMRQQLFQAFARFVLTIRSDPGITTTVANSPRGLERIMTMIKPHVTELAVTRLRVLRYAIASEMAAQRRQITRARKVQKQGDEEDLSDDAITEALISLGFDPASPRAQALMDDASLEFIQQFTDDQREAVRTALSTALAEGRGSAAASRAFRSTIGLTSSQQSSVDSYRQLLERNSSAALERVLRDRRYDPGLQAAIEGDNPLTEARIDTMVGRYADRYLAYRADTIARTETIKVLNQARDEAVKQTVDNYGFAPEDVTRTWTAVQDSRTRDNHAEMDGQVRGLDEPFDSPDGDQLLYPGDPSARPENVINCRCVLQFSFGTGGASAEATAAADEADSEAQ